MVSAAIAGSSAGERLVAAGVAFYGVFGVFVVAFVVLAVVSVRWAIRRDRAGRAEWVRRQQARQDQQARQGGQASPGGPMAGPQARQVPPPATNGHGPRRPGKRGRERNQPG